MSPRSPFFPLLLRLRRRRCCGCLFHGERRVEDVYPETMRHVVPAVVVPAAVLRLRPGCSFVPSFGFSLRFAPLFPPPFSFYCLLLSLAVIVAVAVPVAVPFHPHPPFPAAGPMLLWLELFFLLLRFLYAWLPPFQPLAQCQFVGPRRPSTCHAPTTAMFWSRVAAPGGRFLC